MTDIRSDDDLMFDARLQAGLRELDGSRDLASDVIDRLDRPVERTGRSLGRFAAAALLTVGVLGVVGVAWWTDRESTDSAAADSNGNDLSLLPPAVDVFSKAAIEALPRSTMHVRGIGLGPECVDALSRLPRLRALTLLGNPMYAEQSVDLELLQGLRRTPNLVSLRVLGAVRRGFDLSFVEMLPQLRTFEFHAEDPLEDEALAPILNLHKLEELGLQPLAASPETVAAWGKHFPRLRSMIVRGDTPPPELFEALPPTIESLDAQSSRITEAAIRRLPNLQRLDVRNCFDLVQGGGYAFARGLRPGCVLDTPYGRRYVVSPTGTLDAVPIEVELGARRSQDYGDSAYSIRRVSRDPDVHKNNVDLLYEGGLLYCNMHGGIETQVVDLGAGQLSQESNVPEDGWSRASFVPVEGHVYAMRIQTDERTMFVKVRVRKIVDDRISLAWVPCEGEGPWIYDRWSGAAGTMGRNVVGGR